MKETLRVLSMMMGFAVLAIVGLPKKFEKPKQAKIDHEDSMIRKSASHCNH